MGLAQFNEPTILDKRLFLLSDTQSRITVRGQNAATALNLQLRSPDFFTRTADNAYFVNRITGLLTAPSPNQPRFEVNGLIVEPGQILQYCRNTEDLDHTQPGTAWNSVNSPVFSVPTETSPTGQGASVRVMTSGAGGDGVSQIMTGLDPIATDYRLSVFMKPLDLSPPNVEMFVNFSGSTPDPAITETIVLDPSLGWQRFDLNAFNANVAHNVAEIRFTLTTPGDVAIWGVNFTETDYLASYRPRVQESLTITGEEHLVYSIDAMGIEPEFTQPFTIIWEFIPLGEQGRQAPAIGFAGGDSAGPGVPAPPTLYNKTITFGAHPSVATDFRLGVTDSTSGSAVVTTHTGTYNWSRYSHQKWAFVVFNDGQQKVRFFANGTLLGTGTFTTPLTADNFTAFVLPSAAIHRRIETLAEALSDSQAVAATTIV